MSEGIAQFGDLLATLLANQQYPEGYDEGSLRDLLGQLDPNATSIDSSVADRLEDLAGKLSATPFAEQAHAAHSALQSLSRGAGHGELVESMARGSRGALRQAQGVRDEETHRVQSMARDDMRVPQFTFDVRVDADTRSGMLDFIEWVQKEHETNRTDENPIFFGLNHFYYWLALIKRDAPAYLAIGEPAVKALIQSGMILFGGFQEQSDDQKKVFNKLEALEEKAKITVAVRKPHVAGWWRTVWERAIISVTPATSGDLGRGPNSGSPPPIVAQGGDDNIQLLAAIIQQVMKEDPALADEWLAEFAKGSRERFRLSERVREMAEGEPIHIPSPSTGEEPALSLSKGQGEGGPEVTRDLTRVFQELGLPGVNTYVAQQYRDALQIPLTPPLSKGDGGISEIFAHVLSLKSAVDALNLNIDVRAGLKPAPTTGVKPGHGEPVESIARVFMSHLSSLETFLDGLDNSQLDTEGKKRTKILGYAALGYVAKTCGDETRATELFGKAGSSATTLLNLDPSLLNDAETIADMLKPYQDGTWQVTFAPGISNAMSNVVKSEGWAKALEDVGAIHTGLNPDPNVWGGDQILDHWNHLDYKLHSLAFLARLAEQPQRGPLLGQGALTVGEPVPATPAISRPAHEQAIIEALLALGESSISVATDVLREDLYRAFAFQLLEDTDNALSILRDVRQAATALGRLDEVERMAQEIINPPSNPPHAREIRTAHLVAAAKGEWDKAIEKAREGKNPGEYLFAVAKIARMARGVMSGDKEAMTAVWLHASGVPAVSHNAPRPPLNLPHKEGLRGGVGELQPAIIPADLPEMKNPTHEEMLAEAIKGFAEQITIIINSSGRGERVKNPDYVMAELGFALKALGRRTDLFTFAKTLAHSFTFRTGAREAKVEEIERRPLESIKPEDLKFEYEKLAWRGNWIGAMEQIELAFSDPLSIAKAYVQLARIALAGRPASSVSAQNPLEIVLSRMAFELHKAPSDQKRVLNAAVTFTFWKAGRLATLAGGFASARDKGLPLSGIDEKLFDAWVDALEQGSWDPRVPRMILPKDLVARLDAAKAKLEVGMWLEALQIIDPPPFSSNSGAAGPPLMSRPFHEQALVLGELTAAYFGKIAIVPGLQVPLAHDPVQFAAKVETAMQEAIEVWEQDAPDGLDFHSAAYLGFIHERLGRTREAQLYFSEAEAYATSDSDSNVDFNRSVVEEIRRGEDCNDILDLSESMVQSGIHEAIEANDWVKAFQCLAGLRTGFARTEALYYLVKKAVEKGVLPDVQRDHNAPPPPLILRGGVQGSPPLRIRGGGEGLRPSTVANHLHDWVKVQLNELTLAGLKDSVPSRFDRVKELMALGFALRLAGFTEEAEKVFDKTTQIVSPGGVTPTLQPKDGLHDYMEYKNGAKDADHFLSFEAPTIDKPLLKLLETKGQKGRIAKAMAAIGNDPRFNSGDNPRLTQYTAMLHVAKMVVDAGKMGDVSPSPFGERVGVRGSVTPAVASATPAGGVTTGATSVGSGLDFFRLRAAGQTMFAELEKVFDRCKSDINGNDPALQRSDAYTMFGISMVTSILVGESEAKAKLQTLKETIETEMAMSERGEIYSLVEKYLAQPGLDSVADLEKVYLEDTILTEPWHDAWVLPAEQGNWKAVAEAFQKNTNDTLHHSSLALVRLAKIMKAKEAELNAAIAAGAGSALPLTPALSPTGRGGIAMHPTFVADFVGYLEPAIEGIVERVGGATGAGSREADLKITEAKEGVGFSLALWMLKGEKPAKEALTGIKGVLEGLREPEVPMAKRRPVLEMIEVCLRGPLEDVVQKFIDWIHAQNYLGVEDDNKAGEYLEKVENGVQFDADKFFEASDPALMAVKLAQKLVEVQRQGALRWAQGERLVSPELDPAQLAEARRVASRLKGLVDELEATERIVPGDEVDDSAYMPVLRKAKELAQMGTWDGAIRIVQKILRGKPKEQFVVFGQLVNLHKQMFGNMMATDAGKSPLPPFSKGGRERGEVIAPEALKGLTIPEFENLPKRSIDSIPEEFRQFIPKMPKVHPFPRMKKMLDSMASLIMAPVDMDGDPTRISIRVFGEPGEGKTILAEMLCAQMGVPLFRFPVSKRTDPSDFKGVYELEEIGINGSKKLVPVFKPGVVQIAMEYGFHVNFDELDMGRENTVASTNPITNPGKYFWLRLPDGRLEKRRVHEGYRAWTTVNGIKETGRKPLGPDFYRRFVSFYWAPWDENETAEVLKNKFENMGGTRRWPPALTQLLAKFHVKMANMARGVAETDTRRRMAPLGGNQKVAFTSRSVLRLAQRLASMGRITAETLSRAIRAEYVLPLAQATDQQLVWDQARAIFRPFIDAQGWDVNAIGEHAIPDPTKESISKEFLNGRKFPKEGKFIWTPQALRLAEEILWNKRLGFDVMLMGPSGESKTAFPQALAELIQAAFYSYEASAETDREDLVGGLGYDRHGRTVFVPEQVTLAVEARQAVLLLDEWLLADTANTEEITNPLHDDTQALILNNPYRKISRKDLLVIYSSNPPFDPRYRGRYQQSGAAMSRVPTIYMAGRFAMQKEDRVVIGEAWNAHPMALPRVDIDLVKGKFRGMVGPIFRMSVKPDQAVSMSDTQTSGHPDPQTRFYDLKVHDEMAAIYGAPTNLVIDLKERKLLERDGEALIPIRPETVAKLQEIAGRMARFLRANRLVEAGKEIPIYVLASGGHSTDVSTGAVYLNLLDLARYSEDAALGVGDHETAHSLIDGGHENYDADQLVRLAAHLGDEEAQSYAGGFELMRLFANYVGDPRMHGFAMSWNEESERHILAMLDQSGWTRERTEEEIQFFKEKLLPHEQFLEILIYAWRFWKIPDYVDNPAVKAALDEALPILAEAMHLFPLSTSRAHVEEALAKFYAILDRAVPIYLRLMLESARQLAEKIMKGERPESLERPMQRVPRMSSPPGGTPPPVTPATSEGQERGASAGEPVQGGDQENVRGSPNMDPRSHDLRQAGMTEGGGDDKQAGHPDIQAPEQPQGGLESGAQPGEAGLPQQSIGKGEGSVGANGVRPNEVGAGSPRPGESSPSPQPSPARGEGNKNIPSPSTGEEPVLSLSKDEGDDVVSLSNQGDSEVIPPEILARAKQIIQKRAQWLADQLEPRDEAHFQERKKALAEAAAKAQAKADAKRKAKAEGKPDPDTAADQPLDTADLQKVDSESAAALERTLDHNLFRKILPDAAITAAEQLPKIVPRVIPTWSATAERKGQRIHRHAAVQAIAGPRPTTKVWKRRSEPEGHDARMVFIPDVSDSINQAHATQNLLRATASLIYMAEHPGLDTEYGVILLGTKAEPAKPLSGPLMSDVRRNELLEKVKSALAVGQSTDIRGSLAMAIDWIEGNPGESNHIVMITDAEETVAGEEEDIPTLLARAEDLGIHVSVIAVGNAQKWVKKYLKEGQYFLAAPDGRDIPSQTINLFKQCHTDRLPQAQQAVVRDDRRGPHNKPATLKPQGARSWQEWAAQRGRQWVPSRRAHVHLVGSPTKAPLKLVSSEPEVDGQADGAPTDHRSKHRKTATPRDRHLSPGAARAPVSPASTLLLRR